MRLEIRASEALVRRLDAFAAERGMNRSQALRAAVLEASPDAAGPPLAPDHDELLRLLGEAARGGSVSAMRTLLAEYRRSAVPAGSSVIDELARRRTPKPTPGGRRQPLASGASDDPAVTVSLPDAFQAGHQGGGPNP